MHPVSQPVENQRIGRYHISTFQDETVRAYLPPPLPPVPPVDLSPFHRRLEDASRSLGLLDGLSLVLPDISLFLYFYVRKEALVSSQIEGTQSSLSDLLAYETGEVPQSGAQDAEEVSNYIRALNHGMDRMREGMPLSLRLLREIHAILLSGTRGSDKLPGEFRRSQNWIGGSRPGTAVFVPPPPEALMEYLGPLEHFLHQEDPAMPLIVKAALAHVQFETIHPFLDGNGRLGRLLITLLLCANGALREPILYLSLYFKQHRSLYYDLLNRVRTHGDWESWLSYFLDAVQSTADQGFNAARRILTLYREDRARIETPSALRLFESCLRRPIFTIPAAAKATGLTFNTIAKAVNNLESLGILQEHGQRAWKRQYVYAKYWAILAEDTEPLPRG